MGLVALISFTAAMLALAASPGPGVFATVARALASGFRPALAVIAGIVLGDIMYLMFAILGLSVVARALGGLFVAVKVCGGAYLVWLGLKIWLTEPAAEPKEPAGQRSGSSNLIGGLLITLSNPKVILFYCGFLPTFVDLSTLKPLDITMIAGVVVIVLAGVLTVYAYLASRARRLFASPRAMKRLNRASGTVMMATGVAVAVKS